MTDVSPVAADHRVSLILDLEVRAIAGPDHVFRRRRTAVFDEVGVVPHRGTTYTTALGGGPPAKRLPHGTVIRPLSRICGPMSVRSLTAIASARMRASAPRPRRTHEARPSAGQLAELRTSSRHGPASERHLGTWRGITCYPAYLSHTAAPVGRSPGRHLPRGLLTSGRSRYDHHRRQVVAPDPAGSLDRMQNSLPSGSARVIQPLPSGRR
jgi:hypothetical protein